MVRDGEKFTHIGPLVANNSDIAKKLIIAATLNNLGNKTVIIDVIDMHNDFVRYLLNSGFSEQRYFTRMYKGRNIEGNPGKYFAVAGPEFG
jgi:hypothetical protein